MTLILALARRQKVSSGASLESFNSKPVPGYSPKVEPHAMTDNTTDITPSLENPFAEHSEQEFIVPGQLASAPGLYEEALKSGWELQQRPYLASGTKNTQRQHLKNRMTIWERIDCLADEPPTILFQNWGPNLDGASLVTALVKVGGRDVALYGHDFTVRAGSMDATNGKKLARLFELAAKRRIPLVGLNDSAGAYIPAGVGGLDGYADAFTALRKISGVVPSIMCMFGFNAGGGSYLPRQGSFLIQPNNTFFGLTGPGVVWVAARSWSRMVCTLRWRSRASTRRSSRNARSGMPTRPAARG